MNVREFLEDSSSNDSMAMDNVTYCPDSLNNTHFRWMIALGECVASPRLLAAFFIGLSSILCWVLAQAPWVGEEFCSRRSNGRPGYLSCFVLFASQLVTNCRTGKADKALSFWFLLQWFAGDATNLVGAFLTKQLLTQVLVNKHHSRTNRCWSGSIVSVTRSRE